MSERLPTQTRLPFDEQPDGGTGRKCLACGGDTRVVPATRYGIPFEKCTQCGVEREIAKVRRGGSS